MATPTQEERLVALENAARGNPYKDPWAPDSPQKLPNPSPSAKSGPPWKQGEVFISWPAISDSSGYEVVFTDFAGVTSPVRTTTATSMSYTDLSPGDYVFGVRATGQVPEETSDFGLANVTVSKPSDQDGSKPWPLPPEKGKPWIPKKLSDAPPYPTAGNVVAPGAGIDLSTLTKASKLLPGEYKTSGDIKVPIVGTLDANGRPTLCTIKIPDGKSVKCRDIAGVTTVGGGTKGDNMEVNGSLFPQSGAVVHTCRITGGAGLGVLFVRSAGGGMWFTEIDNCDCGSWGASKCTDLVVRGNYFHHVNSVGRRNTNKCVRCEGTHVEDNIFHLGRGGHHWWDQYNCRKKRGYVRRNYFGSCTTDDNDQPHSVQAFRSEINGKFGLDFTENYVETFYSCDETFDPFVARNYFVGEVYPNVILLRNDKRGTPEVMWLENVEITANVFGPKACVAASSDHPPTISGNKIDVHDNTWLGDPKPRVKVPA